MKNIIFIFALFAILETQAQTSLSRYGLPDGTIVKPVTPLNFHFTMGLQGFNSYEAGFKNITPAATASVLCPYKRLTGEYQVLYSPQGVWSHRLAVGIRLFTVKAGHW